MYFRVRGGFVIRCWTGGAIGGENQYDKIRHIHGKAESNCIYSEDRSIE